MLSPAGVLLPLLPCLLRVLSLLSARLCPQEVMSTLQWLTDGDGQTDGRQLRQELGAGSIFESDVTGEASLAWDCSAPRLRSPEGALSLQLEAAREEGGVSSDRPARGCGHPAALWSLGYQQWVWSWWSMFKHLKESISSGKRPHKGNHWKSTVCNPEEIPYKVLTILAPDLGLPVSITVRK
ncbi:uncharacterized protein LOC144377071 isoform X2 [Ictidomys tridecemlineatus]